MYDYTARDEDTDSEATESLTSEMEDNMSELECFEGEYEDDETLDYEYDAVIVVFYP